MQPKLLDDGTVMYEPAKFRETTIDVDGIRARFDDIGIETDWDAVARMQSERNDIEHLYSRSGAGAVAKFIADIFPVLQEFITNELGRAPADLLANTWQSMLGTAQFWSARLGACQEAWRQCAPPGKMLSIALNCSCRECASQLVRPVEKNGNAKDWEQGLEYVCEACGATGDAVQLLEECLVEEEGYDPFSGEESPTEECPSCGRETYVHAKGQCLWCGHEPEYQECVVCGNSLSLEEQQFHGLCSYHAYVAERERDT